jgi:hypothetical protein
VDERGNVIGIVSAKLKAPVTVTGNLRMLSNPRKTPQCWCWCIDSKIANSGNNSAPRRFMVDNCI